MKQMKVKLEDVCERGTSNLKQSDIAKTSGDYPIYGASGYIGNTNFYHQEKPYVAVVKDGAGVGRAALYPANSSVIGTMQYLLPKDNVLPKYLFYVVSYMHLEKYYTGATIPHIYFKDYKNEEFNLDLLERQAEIVEILEKCEKIIEKRKQEIQLLDQFIKARFVEMFGDCDDMVSISDLCSIITDGTHQSPKFQESGIPFILVSNLSNNTVTYNTEKYISEETYNELYKRTPIEKGDLLLSTVGSYGHPAVVTENTRFLFQRHIAYLKPKREVVNSFYLHSALLAPDGQRQIEEKVKGIAQKTLNLSEIRTIRIPVPEIEEQNAFEDFVHQVTKSKVVVQKALDETQLLFDSLMQQYFG